MLVEIKSYATYFCKAPYSPLFGHHGSLKEYVQMAKLTTYRLSPEQIADVLEHDPRTIRAWQTALGQKSRSVHLALCPLIGLTLGGGATRRTVVGVPSQKPTTVGVYWL
jgi:hypothetical protein